MFLLGRFLLSFMAIVPTVIPGVRGQFVNPGLVTGDIGVHDPTVVKTPSNTYILAHTGDNVQLKTSDDRTAWRNAGPVFPDGAPWTAQYTGGAASLWAPDISYHNNQYYLYYSASTFGSTTSAIFLATSATGESGSWTDQGLVIESNDASGYNCIDANLIVEDNGQWWMSFGSFSGGLKMVAIDPATGKRADDEVLPLAARPNNGNELEAPFIIRNGDYYYLWVSFDRCCSGAASTYRTMVGRSSSVVGPYVDSNGVEMLNGGGNEILAGHGSIHGPGHSAVFTDTDGDVLVYHYYGDDDGSYLGINLLRYEDGWPVAY